MDASNETVIPGLIEIHTHLSKEYGEALGRDVPRLGHHDRPQSRDQHVRDAENREAFESGARIGPRLFTTGPPFDGTRVYYPGGMSLDDTGLLPLALSARVTPASTSSRPT